MEVRVDGSLGRRASGGARVRMLSAHCRRPDYLALLLAVTLVSASCASKAPPNLSPTGVRVWQANEVVNVLVALQRAAIAFNAEEACSEDPVPVCSPMLSEGNTRVVVEATRDALTVLKAVPSSWYATGLAAVQRIEGRLGAAGQTRVQAYITAVRFVLSNLVRQ